jgi:hypothetical protein
VELILAMFWRLRRRLVGAADLALLGDQPLDVALGEPREATTPNGLNAVVLQLAFKRARRPLQAFGDLRGWPAGRLAATRLQALTQGPTDCL